MQYTVLKFPASVDPDLDIMMLRDACLTDSCHVKHQHGKIVVCIPMEQAANIVTRIVADGWLAAV